MSVFSSFPAITHGCSCILCPEADLRRLHKSRVCGWGTALYLQVIKPPVRSIEKVLTCYGGDVSRLLDGENQRSEGFFYPSDLQSKLHLGRLAIASLMVTHTAALCLPA